MSRNAARPCVLVGPALVLLIVVRAVATVVLTLADGAGDETWGLLLFAVPCGIVGGIVLTARPRHPVGAVFAMSGLAFVGQQFAGHWALYDRVVAPLPLAEAAAWVQTWLWAPGLIAFGTYLLLLFPDGRLLSPRWRPVAVFGVIWLAVAAGLSAFFPGDAHIAVGAGSGVVNPLGVEALRPFGWVLDAVVPLAWLGLSLAAVASLVLRFRRADAEQRTQVKWLAYAAVVFLVAEPLAVLTGFPPEGLGPGVLVPVAAAVAILRHRLYDIDRLINRTLVYTALTACVVGVYAGVVVGLGALLRADDGLVVPLVGAGLVAVLFAPLRERLQRAVNRLLYGDRVDPYRALTLLGRRLEDTLPPEEVLPVVVGTIAEELRLPYVAVEVAGGATVEHGARPSGGLEALPLPYAGEVVGSLLIAPASLSPADRRVLTDLARQVGAAVHAVQLSVDLQHSRERLVSAREEERRRLGRELHDGLGPQLAGLSMKVDAARALLATEPERAEALLLSLADQAEGAVADLRRMAYLLRPPALDTLGLVGALRAVADQQPLPIEVSAPDPLPPLPAAVEVAVYRIAVEAMRNAVRHAAASGCTVRLEVGDGSVRLEVTDDGRGLSPGAAEGVGLASVRERAAELGGSCTVGPRPGGGVRLTASVPCRSPLAVQP